MASKSATQPVAFDIVTVAGALSPARMNFSLLGADKDSVLRELTALVVSPAKKRLFNALFKALKAREDLCTTCVNEGVAMPHSRNAIVGLVEHPVIAYGQHPKGVDYGAFDGQPVHHFFLLCAPNVRQHLQLLARLARLLHNPQFRAKLDTLKTPDDLLALVQHYEPPPA
jgi:mannitol/fructose-specific phosphotransferase system IIA component (Ntr-type)